MYFEFTNLAIETLKMEFDDHCDDLRTLEKEDRG